MRCFGLLNINKPPGITSRHVVDRVVRLVGPAKAGHAGTLDPLATGVLVVCVGPATRLIEYVQRLPKRYRAEFLLGRSSATDDVEGEVTLIDGAREPTLTEIEEAAARFVGTIEQRPPDYSAVHVGGKRAYDLARSGKPVTLAARPVEVHSITIFDYAHPRLVLDIDCGSGTYIRSIGRDLAQSLGTAAVMSALERTAIGPFHVAGGVRLDELTRENVESQLRSPLEALADLTVLELSSDELTEVRHGRTIRRPVGSADREWAATDADGRLVALLERRGDGSLGPTRVFLPDAS